MTVVDTGAMLALIDASEDFHPVFRDLYDENPDAWILPWAVLPEVDYLIGARLGAKAQDAYLAHLANGASSVEWGRDEDLAVARRI